LQHPAFLTLFSDKNAHICAFLSLNVHTVYLTTLMHAGAGKTSGAWLRRATLRDNYRQISQQEAKLSLW